MNHKVPGDGEGLSYLLLQHRRNAPISAHGEDVDNAGVERSELKWCTLACEHADWPEENMDGARSCRTFSALYCNALDEHVTRNTPCALLSGQRRPKPNW